jgi:hypothetical protein
MSQNNFDDIDIPDEDLIEQEEQGRPRKVGYSPAAKIGMMIGVGLAAIGLAYVLTGQGEVEMSSTSTPPNIDATPGGNVQATSAEYQENLRRENERRANLAGELGVTFTPTPEVLLQPEQIAPVQETETVEAEPAPQEPVVERQETRRILLPAPAATPAPAPTPEPQVAAAEPAQSAPAPEQQQEENPFISRMIGQMGAVSQRQELLPMTANRVAVVEAPAEEAAAEGAAGQEAATDAASQDLIFRPGDVLYGETMTTVSSDDEAPVLVEIVAGPQKGARLVGEISPNRQAANLVVNFTSMTLSDGSVVAIDAYAVDGKSAEMAVASDVERRYLQRYGPILAASFISAYAQARSQPARSVVGVGDNFQVDREAPTTEQSLFAGLGAASSVIAADILRSAPDGPKIILRAGFPIAILMVEPVSESVPVAPAGSDRTTNTLVQSDMRQN